MTATTDSPTGTTNGMLRSVQALRPLDWLSDGWADLKAHWPASMTHGLLVTGLGWVILLFATTHVYLMAAAVSGFLLIGPVMATGLCELSRRRSRNESMNFDDSLEALGRNRPALTRFSLVLLGISLGWFLLSVLTLQAIFGQAAPALVDTVWGDFLATVTPLQAVLYFAAGGVLAVLVFVCSVVSVPAIIDRPLSAAAAIRLSWTVCCRNPAAMVVWSALIVTLTAIGFATFLLGLIVIYPWLGHATWYAYRDLVQQHN
jgi:uncharacterized membrane protein